ncbi:MAG: hypothetical protein HY906_10125 [Deltaproteobacteria bacterium]|nr:hypothetical protein [Deltaproteobacteria bacterium]
MTSRRQRRRLAREGAAALRDRPGWDPARTAVESPIEKLAGTARAAAAEAMAGRTADCAACAARRQEQGDGTALCDGHFAALVGIGAKVGR